MAIFESQIYRTKGGQDVYLIRVDTKADEVRVVYNRTHHNGTTSGESTLASNLDSQEQWPFHIKIKAKEAIADLQNTISKLDINSANRT